MKKVVTINFILISLFANAQLFTGTGGTIQNNGQDTYFNLSVSGLSPAQLNSTFGIEEVCLDITHPAVQELYIYLKSPDGKIVELTAGSSCTGANYISTCFDSKLSNSITLGSTPYTGSYKSTGFLGRFNNGQTGNGTWILIVHDYLAFINSGSLINWSIKFGNAPSPPVAFSSSNLPIVIINTNNKTISDSETVVDMGIIDNGTSQRNYTTDSWNNYNGKTMIHIRGSSSKNFEKKSYSLETRDLLDNDLDVSLLGMPAESDWALIASYTDKSLMRNLITYDLFQQMGHYSPRFKKVEIIIDNEYQGVYALIEKPKRGKNRIDVSKLTSIDNAEPDITGGYILKIDRPDEAGWYSLFPGNSQTNSKFYYQYVYPKDTAITVQQKTYIKNFMDDFETAINSPSFDSQTDGYPKYINTETFIDYFILNELSKNVDAYRLSTYLYKDKISKGGKLSIGPVWDYDIAWHNCNYANSFDASGWEYQIQDTAYPNPTWWLRFLQDINFVNQLNCRWVELRQGILATNYLNNYIDATASMLNEAQQRNFTQWPILGAYIFPNPQNQVNANYLTEVDDLKNWVTNRITWLDANMPGICTSIGIQKNDFNNSIAVYPNPFTSTTSFELRLIEEADVSLKIIDLMGKEVATLINEHKPSGEFKIIFNRMETSAGIYFYQLKINDTLQAGKIIIQ